MNTLLSNIKNSRLAFSGLLAALLFSGHTQAATCSYVIQDEWDNGFKAEIAIANNSDSFSDWQLTWSWSDSTSINNHWNAEISCDNAGCVATPPSWKPLINTGAVYKFGFVANKGSNSVEIPNINGDVCDGSAPAHLTWLLNTADSNLSYVSIKKDHVAELNHFSRNEDNVIPLSGSIKSDGTALLKIDLNSVESAIDIRNSRLLSFLF